MEPEVEVLEVIQILLLELMELIILGVAVEEQEVLLEMVVAE